MATLTTLFVQATLEMARDSANREEKNAGLLSESRFNTLPSSLQHLQARDYSMSQDYGHDTNQGQAQGQGQGGQPYGAYDMQGGMQGASQEPEQEPRGIQALRELARALQGHTQAKNQARMDAQNARRHETVRSAARPLGEYLGGRLGEGVSWLAGEKTTPGWRGWFGDKTPRIDPTEAKTLGSILGGMTAGELGVRISDKFQENQRLKDMLNNLGNL